MSAHERRECHECQGEGESHKSPKIAQPIHGWVLAAEGTSPVRDDRKRANYNAGPVQASGRN